MRGETGWLTARRSVCMGERVDLLNDTISHYAIGCVQLLNI